MLAHERHGAGPPLVLIHGTNSSRGVWRPLLPALAAEREVIAVDLPGHGDSPAGSGPGARAPRGLAAAVAALIDALGLDAPAVVGHSVGGWTALELALTGHTRAVLALTPAGLWLRRSPLMTNVGLVTDWTLGQIGGGLIEPVLRRPGGRAFALRRVCVDPRAVPADVAIATAWTARATRGFPAHFAQTRGLRFTGGGAIPASLPVRVVWGAEDRIALERRSRHRDELPAHAEVETWASCGHMTMWDQPERTVAAALALPA